MFDRIDDTIVATSSPPGGSMRGIVRLSGSDAVSIAHQLFKPDSGRALLEMTGHQRVFGQVSIDEQALVPAEAYVFRAPASYTRQDVVELHTVGSPAVLAMLLDLLTKAGARAAEPGEFTARAYFAGALGLTEVEGVAAMIQARNDSQLRASEALLHGRLSRRSAELREELAELLALLEAEIDFVEESIEFVAVGQVVDILQHVFGALDVMLREAPDLERLEVLPRVMMVGRPNAGKSTLFNRLTGMDRAISSATAGTTRDLLSAPLSVPGGEVTLLDSAGIEEQGSDAGMASDHPTALAQSVTRRFLGTADLLLLVVDAQVESASSIPLLRSLLPDRPTLIVANKMDCFSAGTTALSEIQAVAYVSALTGAGLDRLLERMGGAIFSESPAHGEELLALSNRQRTELSNARAGLQRALEMCENAKDLKSFAELLTIEVRDALNALSLLSGEIATEELLGRIFARFCIGK